jgi:putative ABC transport system permease protein
LTTEDLANHLAHPYTILARLKPGVTRRAAQAELDALSQSLAREFPATNTGWRAVLSPITEKMLGSIRPTLLVLMGAVGFVLLIACMNVSNLIMARGFTQSRDLAMRTALGATRRHIAWIMLRESLRIALCGGALGMLFAHWWVKALLLLLPDRTIAGLPGADRALVNGRVLLFSLAATLVCGILFGLAPALRLSRTSPADVLREGGRGGAGRRGERRLLTTLIAVEAALSVLLLAGAGLLIRSLSNLLHVQPGFRPEHVLTVQIPAPWEDVSRRPDEASVERRKIYLQEIGARIESLPGVSVAGVVTTLPLGPVNVQTRIFIEGRPAPGPGEDIRILYRASTPGYFRAMGIPLLRGRLFEAGDRTGQMSVAIVNDAMARRYWPGEDALGRRISFAGRNGPWTTVIGIAGDVRQNGLETDPVPEIYTSIAQTLLGPQVSTVVLRTAGDPAALGSAVRAAIRQMNPAQPITELKTMDQVLWELSARPRLYTILLAVFAVLALLLAASGIFSVISWTVSRSTREIGIRMALGASPRDVVAGSMRRTLAAAAAGALLGVAAALPLARVLASQLYGITAQDPLTLACVPLLLMAVAALAAYLPARRATRVDPVAALR